MAVPKKRTSKMMKNKRKANWKKKAKVSATAAFSLAKSILSNKQKSFIYKLEKKTSE